MTSPNVPAAAYERQSGVLQDQNVLYMTPKNHPLSGGIFISPNERNAPPLPAKKQYSDEMQCPSARILDAQKDREKQLSQKEKAKLFDEEKQDLYNKGIITENEIYEISSPAELRNIVEARQTYAHPNKNSYSAGFPNTAYPGTNPYSSGQTGYPGVTNASHGYFGQDNGYLGQTGYSPLPNSAQVYPDFGIQGNQPYPGSAGYPRTKASDGLNDEQLAQLLQSGVISQQDIINSEKAQKDLDINKKVKL